MRLPVTVFKTENQWKKFEHGEYDFSNILLDNEYSKYKNAHPYANVLLEESKTDWIQVTLEILRFSAILLAVFIFTILLVVVFGE
jgi:hypothetical protein